MHYSIRVHYHFRFPSMLEKYTYYYNNFQNYNIRPNTDHDGRCGVLWITIVFTMAV